MKKILGLCLLLGLVGCNKDTDQAHVDDYPPEDTTDYKEQLEVDPNMQGYLSYEIGDLVKSLMLDKEQKIFDWDHRANDDKIYWLTQGYQESYDSYNNQYRSKREGAVRVHILGERVSELKDRKYEVPWLITYEGAAAKFGVESMTIQPSGNFQTFNDPLTSFKKAGVKFTELCNKAQAGEMVKQYKVSARGKQEMYLLDIESGGSGGSSRWLELSLQDKSEQWCTTY